MKKTTTNFILRLTAAVALPCRPTLDTATWGEIAIVTQ